MANKLITLLLSLSILALAIYMVMFRVIVFSEINYLNEEIERLDRFGGALYQIRKE